MGRRRVYASNAERQRAYRQRHAQEQQPRHAQEQQPRRAQQQRPARRAQQERPARPRRDRHEAWRTRPIVALDGEGVDTPDGGHRYTLLAASDGEQLAWIEEWERGLTTEACLQFVFALDARYRARYGRQPLYVLYAASYDFTMMLRTLAEHAILQLYRAGRVDWWCDGQKYRIILRQQKFLQLMRFSGTTKESVILYDVFGFFQTSFVKALLAWNVADAEALSELQAMKEQRAHFATVAREAIRDYNARELQYLIRLVEALRRALDACGFYIPAWHGPGAIARYLFLRHGVKKAIRKEWPDEVEHAILCAYFGGRVQMCRSGIFRTAVFHDIVSAYPAALATLPSLAGARLERASTFVDEPWSLWRVRWRVPPRTPVQPFPLRVDGMIYYLNCGEGWYWYPEVRAALNGFGAEQIEVLEGFVFTCSRERPFAFLRDLFALRREYKAAGNAAEKVLKLGYNSAYGKLAQSRRRADELAPAFQCYWLAGYATSVCRARVLELALRAPESIIAIATDGVLATERLTRDDEEGDDLGQWERRAVAQLLMVQPGVYAVWEEPTSPPIYRSRGFRPSGVPWEEIARFYREAEQVPPGKRFLVPVRQFVGVCTAASRGIVGRMGRWERTVKELHLCPAPDRAFGDFRIVDQQVRWWGRLEDAMMEPIPAISQPYRPRERLPADDDYLLTLEEIADNPELWYDDRD